MATKIKGDEEILTYGFDWSDWLTQEGTTIATSTWNVPAGLTEVEDQSTTTHTTVKISGGTADTTYEIQNIITTQTPPGLTAERSMIIAVIASRYK